MSRALEALRGYGLEQSPTLRAWMAVENTNRPPVIDQDGFRWRNDDGSETAATWAAARDANIESAPGANRVWRIRALINQSVTNANFDLAQAYRLRYSLNGGAYTVVPAQGTTGVPVRYFDSTHLTHQQATTELLEGANTFRAGSVDEQGATATITWASNSREDSEMEFVIEIVDANVSVNNTLDFRVYRTTGDALSAYSATPRLTVAVASAPTHESTFTADAPATTLTADTAAGAPPSGDILKPELALSEPVPATVRANNLNLPDTNAEEWEIERHSGDENWTPVAVTAAWPYDDEGRPNGAWTYRARGRRTE
jgi:hypothetical protein